MSQNFRRVKPSRWRVVAGASAACAVAVLVGVVPSRPASGQTSNVTVFLAPEIPPGLSAQSLPTGLSLRAIVQVSNTGTAAAVNQQIVMRLGLKPDSITSVNDGTGNVGTIDPITGAWFHTIPSIAPGTTMIFTASWTKVCPGRWPMAVRVSDKISSLFAQWLGVPDARCAPDESASAQPASYFQLAWPPTASAATTTTLAPGATLATTTSIATTTPTTTPTTSSTTPVATTTRLGATTTALIVPVGVSTAPPLTAVAPTTLPFTTSTLIQLTLLTTTTAVSKPAVTRSATTSPPGSSVFCKTVGGHRYCGPKSSAYKPGQKKAVEVKGKAKKKK